MFKNRFARYISEQTNEGMIRSDCDVLARERCCYHNGLFITRTSFFWFGSLNDIDSKISSNQKSLIISLFQPKCGGRANSVNRESWCPEVQNIFRTTCEGTDGWDIIDGAISQEPLKVVCVLLQSILSAEMYWAMPCIHVSLTKKLLWKGEVAQSANFSSIREDHPFVTA